MPRDPTPIFAATDAADPPEDPPGTNSACLSFFFQGLITEPKKLVSLEDPIANSSLFSLPNNIAPLFHKLFVTVDSYGGIKFDSILLEAVVKTPLVQNISFIPNGNPSNGLFVLLE